MNACDTGSVAITAPVIFCWMKNKAPVLIEALCKVIKHIYYPLEVMLTCVRWCVAFLLSLRHIEEMMAEQGVCVDHATVHR